MVFYSTKNRTTLTGKLEESFELDPETHTGGPIKDPLSMFRLV